MQRVAVGWLAWTLTHSGAWLGIISMAEFFPVVFLSPLAGALADRRDRVGIIRVTQIAGSIEATLLAVLVYTGAITIELLFALTFGTERRNPLLAAGFSIGAVALTYLLFAVALKTPLERGILGF